MIRDLRIGHAPSVAMDSAGNKTHRHSVLGCKIGCAPQFRNPDHLALIALQHRQSPIVRFRAETVDTWTTVMRSSLCLNGLAQ